MNSINHKAHSEKHCHLIDSLIKKMIFLREIEMQEQSNVCWENRKNVIKCGQSFLEIRLVLRLRFFECLNFLQVCQHFFDVRIIVEADVEPGRAALNLRHKEHVGCCDWITKAVHSTRFLQHCFDCLHPSDYPILRPLYFVAFVLLWHFLKASQVLVWVDGWVDDLAEAADLRLQYWVCRVQSILRVGLIEVFDDGSRLDEHSPIGQLDRRDALHRHTSLLRSDWCFCTLRCFALP